MKKIQMIVVLLLVTLVAGQGLVWAEAVAGKINSVNAEAKSISVAKTAADGAMENVEIWVKDDTQYSGAASLAELQAGDEVTIEAEADATTGNWMANSVEVKAPAAAEAEL